MGAFGLVYERSVIRTILSRTWHVQLIATLATSITLTNLAILVFGTQPKEVPTTLSSAILEVGGVRMAWQRLVVLVAAGGILAGPQRVSTPAKGGEGRPGRSRNPPGARREGWRGSGRAGWRARSATSCTC